MTETPPITQVTGGVDGIAAGYASMLSLARRYDDAGDRMRGWAARAATMAADPDLVESAPLSPVTFAQAEAAVLDAATGLHGVLESSACYEADAVGIRATVTAYQQCDRLVAAAMHAVDYELGRAAGTALTLGGPAVAADLACAVPVAMAIAPYLPDPVRRRLDDSGQAAGDLTLETLERHPFVLQHAVDSGGGVLDGLLGGAGVLTGMTPFHPRLSDAAGDVALLYGDERPPRVRARPDLAVQLGRTTPRSVADLMRHLDQTNALSPSDRPGDQGTIEIQTLRSRAGAIRHVVYLPGTDDLATTPLSQDGDVRDLATNLRLIAGDPTTYGAGIQQALHQAGIRPGEPVLLVGHSQGGMEAAAMLARGTPYDVTDVVTAGSPIAQVQDFPQGTQVLSLENRGDAVPLLDGADNPDDPQHVTVQFDDHERSIAANHAITHYIHGAEAVDASTDPSIREQVTTLHQHGFLGGRVVNSQVFQVTR